MSKTKSNLNVLILYTNYGAGHFSCAKEIRELINSNIEYANVYMENVHRIQRPKMTNIVEVGYNNFFTKYANNWFITNLYGIMFNLASLIGPVRYFSVQTTGTRSAKKIIEEKNIDVVICTYPHYIKTEIPCIVTLTDYGFSKAWKTKKDDIYLVNNKRDIDKLLKYKIPRNNIEYSKIPVSSKFTFENNNEKVSSVLLNLGARGQGNFRYITDNINKLLETGIKIGVMTGKNQELFDKLSNMNNDKIQVYPFLKNVYDIIVKYDIVISKAGGLSLSECIQSERPIIVNLSQTLKGQEYDNYKFVLSEGIGDGVKEKYIYKKVLEYLNDENKYKKNLENIKKLKSKINGNKNILDFVKEMQ